MNEHVEMNATAATTPALIHLQDAEAAAAEALRAAKEVYQRASAALRMAEYQNLLSVIETARLVSLRNAKRDPMNREHHLSEAQKHSNALAVYKDWPLTAMTLADTVIALKTDQ